MYIWLKTDFPMCKLFYKHFGGNYCPTCLLISGFQVPKTCSQKNIQHATRHLLAIKAGLITTPNQRA